MNDDLAAYLESIDPRLLDYLDEERDLSLGTVEHLYRYGVALLQGLIEPAHVHADWEDFFPLADTFVLAYGSRRLDFVSRRSSLWSAWRPDEQRCSAPLTGTDLVLLVELVRELGDFVSARQITDKRGKG